MTESMMVLILGNGKSSLGQFVEACEVDTLSPFAVFILDEHNIG